MTCTAGCSAPEGGSDRARDLSTHEPVLLSEVVDLLAPAPGGFYVDATLGGGGHSEALLVASAPTGRVLGIDRDPGAIRRAEAALASYGERFLAVHGSFADIASIVRGVVSSGADGIVADLGLSSDQLGDAARGFAFSSEGPLDMRFDPTRGPTAADLVNELDADELADVLWEYGEERRSRAIARRIVERRPLRTTRELRQAVVSVLGPKRRGADPATRTFQALRIAVNQELLALDRLLEQAPACLAAGGRLAVISYHSLEDRAVKHAFRRLAQEDGFRVVTKKPVTAGASEVSGNPRARSAKLRVLERAA